ncbi:citryl-CoA lyase [Amycolatopsis rhizosphaerae]|uniref:Citryl-CoA lyase n=2 Tax=Amycolatopsis rhizosphaerae TaxID=2053003 RepID=A0A558DIX7_9PSEU|nr:citryl-CoA lyase [Amycolatopsis rhizosphaerae]
MTADVPPAADANPHPITPLRTAIGHSTKDTVEVCGHNLTDELMGEVDFAAVFFLLVSGRLPGKGEARLFNAVLVALADHGLTPSALAARLTYTGAPEAIQGAVAAGLLGAGSVFLGVFEDAGRMLRAESPAADSTDSDLDTIATRVVEDHRSRKARLPGLGHPIHTGGDPRTARLLRIAEEEGLLGPHTRLMLRVQQAASRGRDLPLNAGGASGALLCDLGIDTAALRGIALVARSAGLVGHLVEEAHAPLGRWLWDTAERETTYTHPH